MLSGALACPFDAAPAGGGPLEREYAVLLAAQTMVIDKKFLELALERLPEIITAPAFFLERAGLLNYSGQHD
jgi:hypothetical protein